VAHLPMIVDCHAHLEPRMLDPDRMHEKMQAAGVDRIALIPAMNDPIADTPTRLLSVMRQLMRSRLTRPLVERIHRLTLTRDGDLRLARRVYRIYAQPDNEAVASLVAAKPEWFYGWIFLNPRLPDALEHLERWRAHPGMIGIKLHPHWHDYRTEVAIPILRRAEELGLPVLMHLGFGPRGDFCALCRYFPKLRLISAHAGFPFFEDLWAYKSECPNLYVDLSSPYVDEALARDAVLAMGPRRCLYGTDAPYGFHEVDGSYDYGEIRGWVERLPIRAAERDAVFGDTFLELLHGSR
jgi:predicted TIM-barrel fold metal-dependent hydrolase